VEIDKARCGHKFTARLNSFPVNVILSLTTNRLNPSAEQRPGLALAVNSCENLLG